MKKMIDAITHNAYINLNTDVCKNIVCIKVLINLYLIAKRENSSEIFQAEISEFFFLSE